VGDRRSGSVVGVSQYATYLDGAEEKLNVSGASGPNVEKIVAADPDLVLVPNSTHAYAPERVQQIRDAGIPVFVFGTGTSLEFVADKTELTGRLVGKCDAGRARASEMRESIDEIEAALEDEPTPVGLNYFFGFTSGKNTFIGNVMVTAGLENGAANHGITGFRMINEETVVAMDPAWIVIPSGASVPDTAGYQSTTAVERGQIVRVDSNLLQQPAPRVVQAVETIVKQVHPDAYREYQTGTDPSDSNSGSDDSDSGSDDSNAESDDDVGPTSTNTTKSTPAVAPDRTNRTRVHATGNATVELSDVQTNETVSVVVENASGDETVSVDVADNVTRNRTLASGWGGRAAQRDLQCPDRHRHRDHSHERHQRRESGNGDAVRRVDRQRLDYRLSERQPLGRKRPDSEWRDRRAGEPERPREPTTG
jgi:iron complex transport system substrate-binding protein